ncbi:MAG: YbjN domain-containing protein [Mycobacteriales bacterium]|nr:MAG: YbjN domain-containing protein [Pseudonocardiales bacterium]
MTGTLTRAELDAIIAAALDDGGLDYKRPSEGAFLVTLPGSRKLATMCWLVAGEHSLLVEAFVMRRPDENRERLHDFLLRRNGRMYGVAWSIDAAGDVFLVGRAPLHSVTAAEIDRLLGSVLTYADDTFNTLLEIGFASSIRREWAWRIDRGESVANLAAFARFADPAGQ